MRKLIPGYYPFFKYGGPIGNADEDDTVNGRAPYLAEHQFNIRSNFVEGRGVQLSLEESRKKK